MPYTHYGEIGDVWKHLPLCFFLEKERPLRYVESNSAYPKYHLDPTVRREYGILHLLREMETNCYPAVAQSPYIQLLKREQVNGGIHTYLGSPGLAMGMLQDSSQYVFCDIEEEALAAIRSYADGQYLLSHIQTVSGDSIDRLWSSVDAMGQETFLHIDPYRIFEQNENGHCYADLFAKAVRNGIKTMLWYGYETRDEQKETHSRLRALVQDLDSPLSCIDFYIGSIGSSVTEVNPGVPGCGIVIANLSSSSIEAFNRYADELELIYSHASFMNKTENLIKLPVVLRD